MGLEERRMRAMDVKMVLLSLLTGGIVGALFTFLKLPLPAPPALAGIMGIVGIYLGAKLVDWLKNFF
jgi:XapX domain-containing protein